ncbi:MAG: ABC transporter permease [Tepidanaerobacteraceae bacterium]|jgi:rhamnose transport system permease protein|nr:ABC transporter permease [Tepidanaerobacteraceae bacterium]
MEKISILRNMYLNLKISKFKGIGLVFFILLLSIIIGLRNPNYLTVGNIRDMLLDTTILAIMALGMMLVIVTRGIDLSVASVLALSGMLVGLFVEKYQWAPASVTIFIGLAIGSFCGAITGFIVAKGKVMPIIATLGMMNVYRGLTFVISGGRWVNAHQMPESFKQMTRTSIFGIDFLIFIAILVYIVFYYFIYYTRTGRQIYAVGSNPEAAHITGINIDYILQLVYTLMGSLSGLAGVLWVSRYASAQSDTAMGLEMSVIAACVLGGVKITGGSGEVYGVLLGSILIGIINNALPLVRISPFWKLALQGVIILVAVIINAIIQKKVER